MSRALSSLRQVRLRAGPSTEEPSPPDALLEAVLKAWAQRGRVTELPVKGTSMWPLLKSGERILVRHGGALPAVGEVVVFLQGSRTIAHRVIACRGDGSAFGIRTKGDFTLVADPGWCGIRHLIGVVEAVSIDGAPAGRFGLAGRAGRVIAALSRIQGRVLEPLRDVMTWLAAWRGGRTARRRR